MGDRPSAAASGDGLPRPAPGRYVRRSPVVEAVRWYRNGDHPDDAPDRMRPFVPEAEGLVVRRYRDPRSSGAAACRYCGMANHVHGWIETRAGPDRHGDTTAGWRVCPGDVLVDLGAGLRPVHSDPFFLDYEPADGADG